MKLPHRVIHIELQAPRKPSVGATCNGCGVCCLAEPCPLGMLISLKRSGACRALMWSASDARYLCGALHAPEQVVRERLLGRFSRFTPILAKGLRRLALRWIAVGIGCDSDLEAVASSGDLSAN